MAKLAGTGGGGLPEVATRGGSGMGNVGLWVSSDCIMYAAVTGGNEGEL